MSPITEAMKPSRNSDRQSCASSSELFPKNGTAFATESPTTFVSSRPTIFGSSRRAGIARAIVRHHALEPDAKLCKISNGGLKEGDRTLLALIGQHLHERDPRGIVDADMDELPTDAVVTVDRARISPGDAVAHRADSAELFDIEMDELARMLAFITPYRFGRLQGTELVQSQPT